MHVRVVVIEADLTPLGVGHTDAVQPNNHYLWSISTSTSTYISHATILILDSDDSAHLLNICSR